MQISIPDTAIPNELLDTIAERVMLLFEEKLDERLKLLERSVELPVYPNKNEVKKCLKIGSTKLDRWIASGLKTQVWGEREIRIERTELQRFLKTLEVKS